MAVSDVSELFHFASPLSASESQNVAWVHLLLLGQSALWLLKPLFIEFE